MIPSELLRVSVKGPTLRPRFVDPEDTALIEAAEQVRTAFVDACASGRPVGAVQDELDELAVATTDPKLFRGLTKVARDRCELEADPEVDATALRLEVFRAAAAVAPLGMADDGLGRPTASDVLAAVAQARGSTPEQLSAQLYADLPSERRVVRVDLPDARWLLHRYNVALVQSTLLGATRVELVLKQPTAPRLRQLFRWVKFHQLLHRAEELDEGLKITLDGPVSLFSASTRYGLQLARFFPTLLLQEGGWSLRATVSWGRGRLRKELAVDESAGLRSHVQDTGAWRPKAVEHFLGRFGEGSEDWTLDDAPQVLRSERGALSFPDFALVSGERRLAVEVLGYWRADTLEERLEHLRAHGPPDLLLAVSKRLRAGPAADLPEDPRLIVFADVLPVRTVVARAREWWTPGEVAR